jgi:hypothetical protein
MDRTIHLVRQEKKRNFRVEKHKEITQEVDKFLDANYIREVIYPI